MKSKAAARLQQSSKCSSFSIMLSAVLIIMFLHTQFSVVEAQYKWNFPSTTTSVSGGGANTPTFQYTASPTVTTGTKNAPISSAYGAVFQGTNVGCSNPGQTGLATPMPFTIEIWANVFSNTGDQYLYCNNKVTSLNSYTKRLCVHINNGALQIELSPDTTIDANVAVVNTPLGQNVPTGWNMIQIIVAEDALTIPPSTVVSANVVNEAFPTAPTSTGPITALPTAYVNDASFSVCVGAMLLDSSGQPGTTTAPKRITASNYFTGIVSTLQVRASDNSGGFSSLYSSTCTGACTLCLATGACPYQSLSNKKNSYDFTQRGTSWVASTASSGTGGAFTLAQDNFKYTPYYVDGQGLYFYKTTNQKQCSAGSVKVNHGSFSASAWFRPDSGIGTGTIFSLEPCGGGTTNFAVQLVSGPPYKIQIAPGTVTPIQFPFNAPAGAWSMVTVSVDQISATQSLICVTLNTAAASFCQQYVNYVFTDLGCQSLCIGNSYKGYIKSVTFNDDPLSDKEMTHLVTTTGCSGGCAYCDTYTLQCNPTCAPNQYWSGATTTSCTTCNTLCASCFSSVKGTTCFSCVADITAASPATPGSALVPNQYIYSATTCNICGDGYILYPTEQCDDGNIVSKDGCSSTCLIESLYTCVPCCASQMGPSICTLGSCIKGNNNHVVGPPAYSYKGCDDGNLINNDGCNQYCEVETGWNCIGGALPSTKDTCTEICGDGYDFGKYPCDDGNNINGDGCDEFCKVEPGWTCTGGSIQWPDICTITLAGSCGSTAIADYGIYACNDANPSNNDGCNSQCEVESGWECTGGGAYGPAKWDTCVEVCGDGWNKKQYGCDDGNVNYLLLGSDGCSWGVNTMCNIDGGFACTGSDLWQRDACNEICGDGLHMGNGFWNYLNQNECDDGSQRPGDGCDPLCRTERGWQCGGGSAGVPDVCSPMCGDWRVDGSEHCDDGNLVSGDGCSAICHVEPGMECLGGNNRWRDDCQEICGDGRNAGYFVCDDGNRLDGDGCSSTCTLEAGYQCTGGTQWGPDSCYELCGKGYNLDTILQCDDGNLLNGDGCDSSCKIESGYYCSHAPLGRDKCAEYCGDGIMLGNMQCDDGNLINGDGCSSTCTIENCWVCNAGSPTFCYYPGANALGVANVTLNTNNSQIVIMLNNSGIAQTTFNITKEITMRVDGPLSPYNFSWSVSNQQYLYSQIAQDRLNIEINWHDTQLLGFDAENITLCFVSPLTIKHVTCNYYLNTSACYVFHPDGQEAAARTLLAIQSTEQSIATYGFYTVLGQVGLGALIAMGGLSAGGAWDTFYALQFIHLIPTMSISLPTSTTQLFQTFGWSNLQDDRLGVWMRNVICNDDIPDALLAPTYNFRKQGFANSYFLYNFADTFTIVIIGFLIVPLLSIVKLLLPASLMFINIDNFIRGRFLIAMINVTYLKVCFTVLTNFFRFDASTSSGGFNSYFCLIGLGYLVLIIGFYLTHIIIFKRELNSIKNKILYLGMLQGEELESQRQTLADQVKLLRTSFRARVLFSEYNSDSVWQYGYMLQFCLSRMIYGLILAKLSDRQDWQLFISCTITVLSMVWIAQFKPYSYPFRNFLAVINEILLFYVFTSVSVISRADIVKSYWARLTIPIAQSISYFLFVNAGIWLILQYVGCYMNRGNPSLLKRELDDVNREAILRKQYKNVHKKVQEEKKRIKEEKEAERKAKEEEEKKVKAEEKKKRDQEERNKLLGIPNPNKANKADDADLVIAELPQPDEAKPNTPNGPSNKVHPEEELKKQTNKNPKETPKSKEPTKGDTKQKPTKRDPQDQSIRDPTINDTTEDNMESIDLTESRRSDDPSGDYSDSRTSRDGYSEETSRDLSQRSETATEDQDYTSRSNTEGLQSIDSRDQSRTSNSVPESSFYGTTQQR